MRREPVKPSCSIGTLNLITATFQKRTMTPCRAKILPASCPRRAGACMARFSPYAASWCILDPRVLEMHPSASTACRLLLLRRSHFVGQITLFWARSHFFGPDHTFCCSSDCLGDLEQSRVISGRLQSIPQQYFRVCIVMEARVSTERIRKTL